MKHSIKKLLATILAFASILMLTSTTVFAANSGLIDPTALGSITVHKFDQSGLAAGASHDGTELADTSGLGKPLGGISFTITLLPTSVANSTIADAIAYVNAGVGLNQQNKDTNITGISKFTSLEQGVYLVQEDANSGIATTIAPFLVSIPMTNPIDTSKWMYDIHIYPKNTVLDSTISKSVLDENGNPTNLTNADVGDNVSWMITPSIPATIASIDLANGGYFFITDDLDSRLDYVGATVQLVDGTGSIVHTFTDGTDYTLTAPSAGTSGGIVKVDFNKTAGIDVLKNALLNGYTIQIIVETTINRTALVNLSDSITNSATLNYKNDIDDPSIPVIPVDPIPEVQLGGVALYKWFTDDLAVQTALPGATFTIYASNADAQNGIAIQLSGSSYSLETDAAGYIYFPGKKIEEAMGVALVGNENFYLVEAQAPSGFELLNAIIEAPLGTTVNAENTKLNSGFTLPITGGVGTLIYTIVGLALIGTAVGIFGYQKSKRRKASKN